MMPPWMPDGMADSDLRQPLTRGGRASCNTDRAGDIASRHPSGQAPKITTECRALASSLSVAEFGRLVTEWVTRPGDGPGRSSGPVQPSGAGEVGGVARPWS